MPNNQVIEERIVEMRLDNKNFESGANKTISLLEKLERALHIKGNAKEFDEVANSVERLGEATSRFDTSGMTDGLEKVKNGFTALEIAGMRTISNLTDSIYNFTARTLKSFTVEPVTMGFGKYGEKTTAVSTLTAQGYELEKVNGLMEDLNWFTDETSYNFTDMVGNIAKFTATGQDLDKSVTAMEGIALWAALSGQNAQKASQAMYQLSQAMGKGALKYDDFKSIQNASMDTQEFRQQAAAAAEELGLLKKVGEDAWAVMSEGSAGADDKILKLERKLRDAESDLAYAMEKRSYAKTAQAIAAADRSIEKYQVKIQDLKEDLEALQGNGGGGTMSLAQLFSSEGLSRKEWFTSDVMMNVFNKYSRAVATVKRYTEEHADTVDTASKAMIELRRIGEETAKSLGITLDEAFKQLGYDIDEFSLKALEAGQNARTWTDVVDSVKDAVSTGWMATFEKFFGDAETATKFWTQLANDFYDIFATGGNSRNSILERALLGKVDGVNKTGTAVKNLTAGWEKLEKRLESSGHDMKDFESALIKVSDDATIEAVRGFGSVEEALKNGAFSADIFKKALAELTGQSVDTSEDIEQQAIESTKSLEDMRKVALEVLRGDHGNGSERVKWLEENGYDPELIQAMAGQLKWFGNNVSDEKLIELMEAYYRFNNLGDRLGAQTFAEYVAQSAQMVTEVEETNAALEETNDTLEDAASLYDAIVNGTEEVAEGIEDTKTGGEYFRESLINLIQVIKDVQDASRTAFTRIFGDEDQIADGIFNALKNFHAFTESIQITEDQSAALTGIFSALFAVLKGVGKVAGIAVRIFGALFRAGLSVLGFFGQLIGMLKENKSIETFATAFRNLFEALIAPLRIIAYYAELATRPFRKTVIPKILEKLAHYIGIISIRFAYMSAKLKEFMTSDEFVLKIANAFRSLGFYIRNFKSVLSNFNLGSVFSGAWNIISSLFSSVVNFVRSRDLTSFTSFADSFRSLGEAIGQIKIGSKMLEEIFKPVTDFLTNILGDPQALKAKISNAITTAFEGLKEGLKKNGITDIFKAVRLAGLTVLLSEISGILLAFKNIEKEIQGIPESISKVFGSLSDVLTAYKQKIKVDAYIKLAVAIGILAASLWVLSKVPSDELTHVAVVLAMLFLVLGTIVKKMQGINKIIGEGDHLKVNVFNGLAAKLVGLAALAAVISATIISFKKNNINKTDIEKVLITLGLFMIMVGGFMTGLKKLDFSGAKGSIALMVGAVISLRLLVKPINQLAEIASGEGRLRSALGALAIIAAIATAMMAVLSLFNGSGFSLGKKGMLMSNANGLMKAAGGMVLMALALTMMLKPIKAFAELSASELQLKRGVLALAAVMAVMTAMAAAFSFVKGGSFLKAAAGMALVAIAINLLIPAISAFSALMIGFATGIPWEENTARMEAFKKALEPLEKLAVILFGFGFAILMAGIGISAMTVGVIAGALALVLFAGAIWILSKALDVISEGLPKFIEGLKSIGESLKNDKKSIIGGAVAFGLLTVALIGMVWALGRLFTGGGVGRKFSIFSSSLISGISGMFKTMGAKITDMLPSILSLLGSLTVIIGLYIVGIIPDLTEIAVNAIITLFDSLAKSVSEHKDEFVASVTSIVQTALDVFTDVIQSIFNAETFADMGLMEKILLGIGAAKVGIGLVDNILTPFTKIKNLLGGTGKAGGLIANLTSTEGAIGKVVEAAGGLGVLGPIVAALAASLAYANSNLNSQQEILEEQAFEADTRELEDYGTAIENVKKRIDELQAQSDSGWGDFISDQELEAQKLLLTTLEKEYEELKNKIEDTAIVEDAEQATQAETKLEEEINKVKTYLSELSSNTAVTDMSEKTEESVERTSYAAERLRTLISQLDLSKYGLDLPDLDSLGDAEIIDLAGKLEGLSGLLPEGIGKGISEAWHYATDAMTNGDNDLVTQFINDNEMHSPSERYASLSANIPAGIGKGIVNNRSLAIVPLTALANTMVDSLTNIGTRFYNSGVAIVQGLINGIEQNLQSAYDVGRNLGASVQNGFNDALEIHSPSRVFENLAKFIPLGVAKGVEDNEDSAIQSVTVLSNDLINEIYKAMAGVATIASDDFTIYPTITPVVDMTNARMAAGSVNSMFGKAQGSYVDSITARAGDVNQTVDYNLQNKEMVSEVRALSQRLDQLGQSITNMQIVLDSGVMVGAMTPQLDMQLGKMAVRKGRGN